ncbi:alpha/beta hydrolase family protein [Paenibacillus agri]|uniref:Acetylhydrolase n=1 Tax=Paenibacillus agri TaxID=2744309 RepID=A0A850EV01_9BACL|nr:acetylhydrolase [Paenibacillus agri]NUU64436.1 acetylhydrolase [Paenibacillus agri]
MRLFEVLIVVFNILLIGWILLFKNKSQRGPLIGFGVSAIIMLVHGLVEGMRWPMIPAYVMTALPLVIFAVRLKSKSRLPGEQPARKRSIVKLVLLTLLTVIYSSVAVVLPILFPIFTFNKPAGPYKIGTVTYDWKDDQRDEVLTPDTSDKRELMVQVWYPADAKAKGKTEFYHSEPDIFAEGYSKVFNMPKLLFTAFGKVRTHAIENAEISNAESSYPVLIFSHGLSGTKMQNTFQIELLVSHGYIVVGIDHTYSSTASIFQDGRVAYYQPIDMTSTGPMDQLNDQWVGDAEFVLDQVEKLAANDPEHRFTGRMDMNHVGMFGHSFGGATSVQMVMKDARIKAAINMDGVLYGKLRIPEEGLNKPFLMMSADSSLEALQSTDNSELSDLGKKLMERFDHIADGGNYWMTIKNMTHMGFTDIYLLSPLFQFLQKGNIREAQSLINEYSLDFFDHYLKKKPLRLLEQNIGEHPTFTLQKD